MGAFPIKCLLMLLLSISTTLVFAEQIQKTLPNGIIVNARYIKKDLHQPAILVVHGFLQTYDFMATQNIIEGTSDFGLSVLAPNFSLNISNRKKSLQCNSPHSHHLREDLQELIFWLDFLKAEGFKRIVLVGHSWGSQHIVALLSQYKLPQVTAAILVSLVQSQQSDQEIKQQLLEIKQKNVPKENYLFSFRLSYCNNYSATLQSFYSYAEWNNKKILQSLKTIQKNRTPVYIIIGDQDPRSSKDWLTSLKSVTNNIFEIEGANHFFSNFQQFDLLNTIDNILRKTITGINMKK